MFRAFLLGALVAVSAVPAMAADVARGEARVTTIFDHPLPSVPARACAASRRVRSGRILTVPHPRRICLHHATVIEGAVRSRINDGPEKVFRVGESFVEMPGDHHGVSANASDVEPSKLLAVFVVDTADRVLTTPDKH